MTQTTIILIDDLPALVAGMERVLAHRGYRVLGYTDPREALKAIAHMTVDERDDIAAIVCDHDMPRMTGVEVWGYLDERLRQRFVLHSGSAVKSPSGYAYPKMMGVQGLIDLIERVNNFDALVDEILTEHAGTFEDLAK